MVGESWERPEDWFKTNALNAVTFQNFLRKCNFLKRYVHISTPEVYGNCEGLVDENYQFNPSTPYAVSRAAGDMSLKSYGNAYKLPYVITRAANVYGPGQPLFRIIPKTIMSILLKQKLSLHGGGLSTRSFIHIDDVSEATWKVMINGNNNNSYHISTREIISIKSLIYKICEILNVNFDNHVEISKDRLGKDGSYELDSSKLENELNWKSEIKLNDGLKNCIKWTENNFNVLKDQPMEYFHKE